jgi:pimeloyl-ACP methyl ester carboxylesterase
MSYVLAEVGNPVRSKRSLIFVRGFAGENELWRALAKLRFSDAPRRHQTSWYRGLRAWGYHGQLLTFRWDCHWSHCFSAASRDTLVDEAAEALCELFLRLDYLDPRDVSVLGFSMGGWIIQRALRIARRNGVQIRRAYLFGATAPRASRWPELIECVSDGLWNFHSVEDGVLRRFYPKSVGLSGLPASYDGAHDVDCASLIDSHDQWACGLEDCLRRARLRPSHL